MRPLSRAALAVIIFAVIIWVGCNDSFRPIVLPNPSPGPDPQALSQVFALSNTGTSVGSPGAGIGALSTIDVPGDTITSIEYGGHGPSDLVLIGGGALVFTVNKVDDTLTSLQPANPSAIPTTIPLPAGAQPVYGFSASDSVFVVEPGRNAVAQITIATLTLQKEIAVGNNPVALAQLPNGQKLYVLNQADSTVSVIKVADGTILGTIAVGASPVAVVTSSDGRFVFVANEGGNSVSVIDTTNDTAVLGTIALGASPGCAGEIPCFSITYDPGLKRVYTANRASNTISVIRADQAAPTMPTLLTPAPGVDVTAAPCGGSSPRQVAVLLDGSRAYLANAGTDNVCVFSALSNSFSKSIALPAGAGPTSVAASSDSKKVYTANPGTQNISIIATTSDTVITSLGSPKSDPTCQDPAPPAAPICTHLNPVYVTAK